MEFKALDQVLQTFNKETHEKEAITYRCADMDRIVPSLMGVSKAIHRTPLFKPYTCTSKELLQNHEHEHGLFDLAQADLISLKPPSFNELPTCHEE